MSMVIDLVDSSDSDDSVSSVKSITSSKSSRSTASVNSYRSVNSQLSQASSKASSILPNQYSQNITSSKAIKSTISRSKASSSKLETEIKRQTAGKFKSCEIGIILSSSFETSPLYDTLLKACATDDLSFDGIFYADSFTNYAIRYTFRPKVLGGRATIDAPNTILLPFAVILYPVAEFIRLAELSANSSTAYSYPDLAEGLDQAVSVLCNLDGCPYDTRVVYVLIDIDGEMLKYRKSRPKDARAGIFNLDDILAYLMHERQIEVFQAKTLNHACEYIYSWSKILATTIYKTEATEFENKTRCHKLRADESLPDSEKEKLMLQETWISMLEMIPNMSRQKARTLVREGRYTCPIALINAYSDNSMTTEQKQTLLQSLFAKSEVKLSREIYNMFNQLDPSAIVDS